MMVELNTETMKISVLNTIDQTVWPVDAEENGYTRPVKLHTIFSDKRLDSYDLAYNVFKDAKYVVEQNCMALKCGYIYEVRCTYRSQEESCEYMAYGDFEDDFQSDY